jgi:spore coat polysaccharide biosynthesis protein SpsF
MGSSRMPGKSMAELAGKPALRHIIERLRRVPSLDGIAIATTTEPEDDVIADCARTAGASLYRGSPSDVLERTLEAAKSVDAATVVRVTGDNPLVDPEIVQRVIDAYCRDRPEYASNCLHGDSYPIGMSVEVFPRALLELADAEAQTARQREHVSPFFYEHPERFRLLGVDPPPGQRRPDLRLTLDTAADYELISALYESLYEGNPCFGLDEILAHLDSHPDLAALNARSS